MQQQQLTGTNNVDVAQFQNLDEVHTHFEDENDDDKVDAGNNEDESHFQRKKRKKVSKAHCEFNEVTTKDGVENFQCKHCKSLLSKSATSTTSHLLNHLKRCLQNKLNKRKRKTLQLQPEKSAYEMLLVG
ncbi:unnamed protein product, partial [Cuscuta europaea]